MLEDAIAPAADDARPPRRPDPPPAPRASSGARSSSCSPPASSAGPVFGLLDSGDDFDDPQAEAVLARRDIERATGASASPDMVALVRLGAPADSARAQDKLARVATAFRGPRASRASSATSAAATARWSPRTAAPPTWSRRSARTRSGALDRVQAAPGAHPGRDRRRRRARPGAGRRPGLRGHRARRAARVPDPLPALVLRLPQPRRGAAPARGRRRDDHALVPGDAARQRRDRADVDLRAEPHHRPRARPRDRLLAVHGLALPRGARARARRPRRRCARRWRRRAAPCCSPRSPSRRRSPRCSCSRCASSTRWASAG